jgi:hypothetical protein
MAIAVAGFFDDLYQRSGESINLGLAVGGIDGDSDTRKCWTILNISSRLSRQCTLTAIKVL